MNYKKGISVLLIYLISYAPGWAQKKPLIQAATKAVLDKPAVAAPASRSYAQLLADTKAAINKRGYRPRACITDSHGVRILSRNLNEEQRQEIRLAGIIARTMTAFKLGEINPNDPDLQELQALVEAHPNPRNNYQITPYIIRRQELERQERIAYVYQQALEYIQAHGMRPRAQLREGGISLSLKEIKQHYAPYYDEIHLGMQINQLLGWGKKHAPDHPQIQALKQLVSLYPNTSNAANAETVLQTLRTFILTHNRLPRKLISRNGRHLRIHELSTPEHEETLLAGRVNHLLSTAKSVPSPALDEIKQLVAQYRAQSIQRVLTQLRVFLDTYNRPPREVIYRNNQRLKQADLTPQEQNELLLGSRLDALLYPSKPVSFSAEQAAALKEIKQLLAQYRPPMPSQQELLAQAQAWVTAHDGLRPRKAFYKNAKRVPARTLAREQYEEMLLARRISYVVEHATEITPALEGLQAILQLPMRPQLSHEIPPDVPTTPPGQEEPYDDFEEYF